VDPGEAPSPTGGDGTTPLRTPDDRRRATAGRLTEKNLALLQGGPLAVLSPARATPAPLSTPRRPLITPAESKTVDFMPIILVCSSVHSPIISMWNVKEFIENGHFVPSSVFFVDPEKGATRHTRKPSEAIVTPELVVHWQTLDSYAVKFRRFRVLDDPSKVENWDHVCAAFVTSQEWQVKKFYGGKKTSLAEIFSSLKGFFPVFEEDPLAIETLKWRVKVLTFSRRPAKAHTHTVVARQMWDELYNFLAVHPFFRSYKIAANQ
jgi:hypothetical protein